MHTMAQHYLGDYLVAHGVLSGAQRDEALARQRALNQRVGELASRLGMLTPAQVDDILCCQDADAPFGETAVALGYVSKADRDRLLFHHLVGHHHLGEICISLGFLDKFSCDAAIAEFADQRMRRTERMAQTLDDLGQIAMARLACEAVYRVFLRFTGQRLVLEDVCTPLPLTEGLVYARYDVEAIDASWLMAHDADDFVRASDHPVVIRAGVGVFMNAIAIALREALHRNGVAAVVSHHRVDSRDAPRFDCEKTTLLLRSPAGVIGLMLL